MNEPRVAVSEAELHAYLDGLLEPGRRDAVEIYLAEHGEEAARLGSYARIDAALRRAFDPVLAEPVPLRLQHLPTRRLWQVAAAVAWLGLGVVLGWNLHREDAVMQQPLISRVLVQPAMSAHVVYAPEVGHPVEVPAGDGDGQHLAGWLSKRVGSKLMVPDLVKAGYTLVGGRLLPGEDGAAAAQFMYQDQSGSRVTLYVRSLPKSADHPSSFRYAQQDEFCVFYWVEDSLGYALTGGMDRERLLKVANVIYDQINP